MVKVAPEQWEKVRAYYEAGHTGNQTATKFGLNRRRVQMRIQAEGWDQNLENAIRVQALDKVVGKGANYSVEATAEAVNVEATKRANIEKRHREEPNNVRVLLYQTIKAMNEKATPPDIREIKIAAEAMSMLQAMERKAYRLDGDGATNIGADGNLNLTNITLNIVDPMRHV
jgi:hypothetical protein